MNSYEKIYNILIESTPIGREESKKVGQRAGRAISLTTPGPYGTKSPLEIAGGSSAEDVAKTREKLITTAKEKGQKAVAQGDLQTRLRRRRLPRVGHFPKMPRGSSETMRYTRPGYSKFKYF